MTGDFQMMRRAGPLPMALTTAPWASLQLPSPGSTRRVSSWRKCSRLKCCSRPLISSMILINTGALKGSASFSNAREPKVIFPERRAPCRWMKRRASPSAHERHRPASAANSARWESILGLIRFLSSGKASKRTRLRKNWLERFVESVLNFTRARFSASSTSCFGMPKRGRITDTPLDAVRRVGIPARPHKPHPPARRIITVSA